MGLGSGRCDCSRTWSSWVQSRINEREILPIRDAALICEGGIRYCGNAVRAWIDWSGCICLFPYAHHTIWNAVLTTGIGDAGQLRYAQADAGVPPRLCCVVGIAHSKDTSITVGVRRSSEKRAEHDQFVVGPSGEHTGLCGSCGEVWSQTGAAQVTRACTAA